MELGELDNLWDTVLGRYHRAVQSLVVDILQESQYAVEKLAHAISHMKTPESATTAAITVQKGHFTIISVAIVSGMAKKYFKEAKITTTEH